MNMSGLRKNSIFSSDSIPCFLSGSAAAFGFYHSCYGLLSCHGLARRWMLYLDYGLCLLWMAALGMSLLSRFWLAQKGEKRKAVLAPAGIDIGFWLLVLLMGLIFCSALLTEKVIPGSFRLNRGCIYDAAVSFFVLYPLGRYWGRQKTDTIFRGYLLVITLLFSLCLLLGMVVAFAEDGLTLSQYFYFREQRFSFNTNPNVAALSCCLLLFTALYGFLRGGRAEKILYFLCGVVLYVALMLSDSRGCILSLALGLSILAAVFVWDRTAKRKKPVRFFMAIMAVIVVMLTILACREGTRHILSNWEREPVTVAVENKNDEHVQAPSSGAPERSMVDKKGSGRIKAWKTAFKALKNEPGLWFRGCGPYNIPDVLVANGVINPKNTHNQLLELLLGYGVMPLIVFLAWLLWLAWKCVNLGFNKAFDWALRVLPAGIFAMVMCNMFEARLLFYRYFIGSMFFLLAGLVSASAPKNREASK